MLHISSILKKHFAHLVVGLVLAMSPSCVATARDEPIDAGTSGAAWRWTPYSIGVCLVVDDMLGQDDAIERDTMTALLRWQSNWLNGICDFQREMLPDAIRHTLIKTQCIASTNTGMFDRKIDAGTLTLLQQLDAWDKAETHATGNMPPQMPTAWERYDKVFFIVVRSPKIQAKHGSHDEISSCGWSATIREFDVRTQLFGEIRQVDAAYLSQLPELLFEGMTASLTPITRVVQVDGAAIMLEERAGELLALQETLPPVSQRQVLIPVTRTNDRDGNPQLIRRVDWTFLSVEENSGGLLSTTMQTGLRSPINARMRPRHQQLALLAKPNDDHTTIQFASYISRDMPLPICDVLESISGRRQAVNIGTTSLRGEFRIDYLAERPVRLLYVRNGTNLIARIPVMPGVNRVLTAEVPVADSTLHAESLVLGIQEEILDTLATRQILVSQAVTFRQRSDRKGFDDTVLKLRQLKTQQNYESELNILKLQLPYDDSISRRRIETMIEQTRKFIRDSLPPVEVRWATR